MKIPSNKTWTQTNEAGFGSLAETENISLDNKGKVKLSRKPFSIYSSEGNSALNYILALPYYDNQYFALTDDANFQFSFDDSSILTTSGNSTDQGTNSDAIVIYGLLYITANDSIDTFNGTSYTTGVAVLTADVPHPMTVFDSFTDYKLAVGNGNQVKLLNSSNSFSGTILSLPAQYQVTTLTYRNGYLYVGTKHLNGGEAKVFVWDGNTANANSEIPTGSTWVFSIIPYKETVAFITNQGQLFAISGNSAIQLAALPVYYDANAVWQDDGGVTYMGKVLHRGMVSVGDDVYINLDGSVDSKFMPSMKSGIWVYSPNTGLYHKTYHTTDDYVRDTSLSLASSTITTSAAHKLKDGDTVLFSAIGSMTGVQVDHPYYVSVQSTTSFKIARSRKSLENGDYVSIGGTIGSAAVVYTPNTDWGAGYSGVQGAIALTNPTETAFDNFQSPILWGARVPMPDDNAAYYGLFTFTDKWNIGRFTTEKIYTNNVKQAWGDIFAFINGVLSSGEKIIVKYKTGNKIGYPTNIFRGTWTGATTIQSVSGNEDTDSWADLEDGDEITIINGTGRGYTAHISGTPTESNGTYTVTIDESIGTNTNLVTFYADKFKKLQVFDNTREDINMVQCSIDAKSPWIQLKFEMRGFETEIDLLELTNAVDRSAQ